VTALLQLQHMTAVVLTEVCGALAPPVAGVMATRLRAVASQSLVNCSVSVRRCMVQGGRVRRHLIPTATATAVCWSKAAVLSLIPALAAAGGPRRSPAASARPCMLLRLPVALVGTSAAPGPLCNPRGLRRGRVRTAAALWLGLELRLCAPSGVVDVASGALVALPPTPALCSGLAGVPSVCGPSTSIIARPLLPWMRAGALAPMDARLQRRRGCCGFQLVAASALGTSAIGNGSRVGCIHAIHIPMFAAPDPTLALIRSSAEVLLLVVVALVDPLCVCSLVTPVCSASGSERPPEAHECPQR